MPAEFLKVLEGLCRKTARRVSVDGVECMTHDEDPHLKEAFRLLMWADCQPVYGPTPKKAAAPEAAVVKSSERAELPKPTERKV